MTVDDELERIWKQVIHLNYYASIWLQDKNKPMKHLSKETGLQAEFQTWYLLKMKRDCWPLDGEIRSIINKPTNQKTESKNQTKPNRTEPKRTETNRNETKRNEMNRTNQLHGP
jgi:hypothetical protein